MDFIDKLNSDKTIVETTYYRTNSSGTQGSVSDANATPGMNNEIKTGTPIPLTADAIKQSVIPISFQDLAQQEIKNNQLAARLVNSRKEVIKLQEEQALENALSQLRFDMRFRNITPLPEGLSVATQFPLEGLPDWAFRLVTEIALSLQVPIEAVAPALFGVAFIAARGNYKIKVKSDYHEILTSYIVVVIPSGGRKSAIVYLFRKPINKIEADRQMDFDENATSRKSDSEALVAIKRKVKKKLIKELDFDIESLDDIKVVRKQLSEKLEILERETQQSEARPKLLIDSPTSKELAMEMGRQNEAIGIFEAEGGIWKHRVRPSEDNILLKGFTGEPFGDETTKDSVNMQKPCLAICTYVQEVVAEKLYSNDALKCDGLLPRILTVFVSKNNVSRDPNPRDVSDELVKIYSDKINSLFNIQRPKGQEGERTFHVLELTDEARQSWRGYAARIAERVSAGLFKDFEAFGEKLAGHAVRLAGALHLLKYDVPHDHQIDAATMNAGVALAEYFANHAIVAFDKRHLQGIKFAKKILNWMDRHRKAQFTEREIHRGVGHCEIVDIRAGLNVLERHGYIGCYPTVKRTYCLVNPNLYSPKYYI